MRRILIAAALTVLAASLTSCTADGDAIADQVAQQRVEWLGQTIAPRAAHPRPADYLAEQLLEARLGSSLAPDEHVHVGILNWSGDSGDARGARIEVRLIVDVDDVSGGGIRSHSSGSAVRCWRLTVFAPTRDTTLLVAPIPCPATADRTPDPAPLPALPPDARTRLQDAMATATADSLAARVRAAFPDPQLGVDTLSADGALYAAVGPPTEREQCLLGTRTEGGDVQVSLGGLENYEPSCSTALFFEPTLGR